MTRQPVRRGYPLYGVDLGIILVDSSIPRPVGDIGNGRTFPFPVNYRIAKGMTPDSMVKMDATGIVDAVERAAKSLVAQGVRVLTTSCGLLAKYQSELVERLTTPIATSSLLQVSMLLKILPVNSQLGVLTINAESLRDGGHFDGVGITVSERERVVIAGLEASDHFYDAIMGDTEVLDVERASEEVVATAEELKRSHPNVQGFVLECTNLSPYASDIRERTGLPVWDSITLTNLLYAGYFGTPGA